MQKTTTTTTFLLTLNSRNWAQNYKIPHTTTQ